MTSILTFYSLYLGVFIEIAMNELRNKNRSLFLKQKCFGLVGLTDNDS